MCFGICLLLLVLLWVVLCALNVAGDLCLLVIVCDFSV